MNIVNLIGRLTKDTVLRKTTNGTSVTSFTLAVPRDKDNTDWIPCIAYGKTADLICKYLSKGSKLACEGRINTRNYEDNNGKKVYVTEVLVNTIEFVDSNKKQDEVTNNSTKEEYPYPINILDDDLPF